MLFVVIGFDKEESREKRAELRPAHLDYLKSLHADGCLALAGPFTDGSGSLFILDCETAEKAHEIASKDPYNRGYLFEKVYVKQFKQVLPEP